MFFCFLIRKKIYVYMSMHIQTLTGGIREGLAEKVRGVQEVKEEDAYSRQESSVVEAV